MPCFLGRESSVFQLCLKETWFKFFYFIRIICAVVQQYLSCIYTIHRDLQLSLFYATLVAELPCRIDWSEILSFKNNQISKFSLNWFPDLDYPYLVVQLMRLLAQKKQQYNSIIMRKKRRIGRSSVFLNMSKPCLKTFSIIDILLHRYSCFLVPGQSYLDPYTVYNYHQGF